MAHLSELLERCGEPEATFAATTALVGATRAVLDSCASFATTGTARPHPQRTDPVAEPEAFIEAFRRDGVVIVTNAIRSATAAYAATRAAELSTELSVGAFDLAEPSTWNNIAADGTGTPLAYRGFLELVHDDGLAQVRQSPRLRFAHALLWGAVRLSTTFDRYAIKLPGVLDEALPLHVDQNPNIDPGFASTQGLVASSTTLWKPAPSSLFPARTATSTAGSTPEP